MYKYLESLKATAEWKNMVLNGAKLILVIIVTTELKMALQYN